MKAFISHRVPFCTLLNATGDKLDFSTLVKPRIWCVQSYFIYHFGSMTILCLTCLRVWYSSSAFSDSRV
jgi:hypothetical protein